MSRARELAEFATGYDAGGGLNFRNRIINGDMRIDQRNAGAAVTATDFPVDRWEAAESSDGAATAEQVQDVPSGSGFTDSVKWTTTTADASLTTTQFCRIGQVVEGYNIADLGWGSASAKTITISFWVRSSLTGTFAGGVRNSAGDRSYVFTYTISAADTWEQKSVTIAGDTSGTWLTNNGRGVWLLFDLGSGSSYQKTADAWGSGNCWSTSGATSVIGTLNATWYITGVQLEVGSVATPFERRPYGTELALCQRYYWQLSSSGKGGYANALIYQGWADSTTSSIGIVQLPVTMRTSPTLSTSGTIGDYVFRVPLSQGTTQACATVPVLQTSGTNYLRISATTSGTFTVGAGHYFAFSGNTSGFVGFSAEI